MIKFVLRFLALVLFIIAAIAINSVGLALGLICLSGMLVLLLISAFIGSAVGAASSAVIQVTEQKPIPEDSSLDKQLASQINQLVFFVNQRATLLKSYIFNSLAQNDTFLSYLKDKLSIQEFNRLQRAESNNELDKWSLIDDSDFTTNIKSFYTFFFGNDVTPSRDELDSISKAIANELITIILLNLLRNIPYIVDKTDELPQDINDRVKPILNMSRMLVIRILHDLDYSYCCKEALMSYKDQIIQQDDTILDLEKKKKIKAKHMQKLNNLSNLTDITISNYYDDYIRNQPPISIKDQIKTSRKHIKSGALDFFINNITQLYILRIKYILATRMLSKLTQNS